MEKIKKDIQAAQDYLQKEDVSEQIEKLQKETLAEGFWDDVKKAQITSSQLAKLQKIQDSWKKIQENFETLNEMKEILSPEEFEQEKTQLENFVQKEKIKLFLNKEYDNYNAIVTLSVGAGGVDANDWTSIVLSMLLKYCEQKTWKTEILDTQEADTAGIKSASFRVYGGENIFAYLQSESGAHRLVRPSPFNAKHTRETSFCNVEVVPEIENTKNTEIDDKDLKIETFRAQGAGGQHVNTTDSAVRITHIPSGIVAQCQNDRSQHQNKASALKVLTSRLAEKQRQEENAKQAGLKNEKVQASFGGGHIRSYVLDDRYVKDQRTGIKSSQVDKILNGDLNEFIEAFIIFSASNA